ncbi:PLP-dependent aminotransferase family protein [Planomonospora venezuelensis]|uniref:DNA-binding transcriptional MocR family regulator n=1 Tax=Planomonospora venezuelensis TaxID=1999 RepID=A0A841CTD7_PLAVE|nr:PLP-dependent aminotransferase family protein [Planomonospora venezuelensis]MBB5961682.1 DNA-binding transcriptional MocR family regulator [Planomonospora venezuelensis]GIM98828.1 GntR family transcriptional regulator [Planomonospora venezuelensis]
MRSNLDELTARLGRWSSGRGPLYLLLAVRLRALIDDGELPPGSPLPPERTLARRLAVGRGTVVAAYDQLQQEGKVTRRQGSGTRVSPAAVPATRASAGMAVNPLHQHLLGLPDGVALLSCVAPDEPPPALIEAYAQAAAELAAVRHDIGYHPAGHPALREALAAYYRARGVPTSPGEILVTNGAQQALTLLAAVFLSPGDTVLTEPVTYPGALETFREAAARFRTAAVMPESGPQERGTAEHGPQEARPGEAGAAGPGPAGFGAALAARPALAYLVPTGQNPTGSVMPSLVRRRLAGLAAEYDVPLIDDEVPAELCFSGEPPPPLCSFHPGEQIITIGSLSKIVWGGLRVGWVRAAEPVVSRLARLRAVHDLGGDVLSQFAAARLLARSGELRRERAAVLRRRHDHLLAELARALPSWSVEPALGGQTVWVRLPHGDADAFAQVALRHRVAIPPGRAFDPLGGHGDFVRLPFLFPEEELTDAVNRLAAAWHDYDGSGSARPLPALIL